MTEPAWETDGAAANIRLAGFIRQEMASVVAEWVNFAKTRIPAGASMTHLALQDHIEQILSFIADDLGSPQSDEEQFDKSRGGGLLKTELHQSAAEMHAKLRVTDGFDINEMVSEYRALRASVVKLWLAKNRPTTDTDILDLTRFNEAIDQAIAESVREYSSIINQSRNMFLGILGHDLRNPIGAASMAGETLKRLVAPDTREMSLASRVVDATQRTMQILNDLLDVTRSAFGIEIPIVRAPMGMGRLGVQLVEEMRPLAKGRALEIKIVGDTEGEWDRARMGQVFSNLIGNAIEYSFPDSSISVTVDGAGDQVMISVHNDGVPISADHLASIFEALARGQPTRPGEQGSNHLGLGLYVTKKIVMAHNGDINVASDNSGTTFTIHLPRK